MENIAFKNKRLFFLISLVLLTVCMALIFSGCENNNVVQPEESSDSLAEDETVPVFESEISETTAPETEPPEDIIKRVKFMGVGDNIVYYGNVRDAKSKMLEDGRAYNFKPSYSDIVPYIESADIAFINQETLMCGDGYEFSYYPCFNGPQDMAYDLCELGFDIINIANNHMLDKRANGLSANLNFWETLKTQFNVTMIGGYRNEYDYNDIRIVESNGIKIAFLAYTYGTNGLSLDSGSDLVIPYLNESVTASQVAAAKAIADIVLVSVHWGTENTFVPNNEQKHYAQLFADCGADVVIGHHPHVIQPIEWLTGVDGNKTLCIYSLGNLMAEMENDYNMVGGIINFDIVQTNDEKPIIENVLFTPTVFDFSSSFYDNHIYIMEDYSVEQASTHGISAYKNYTSLEKLTKYVTDTIDSEFLPEFLH